MPRSSITCCRCGYTTDHMGSYKTHIERKRVCKPLRSHDMPTMSNFMRDLAAPPASTVVNAHSVTINNGCSTTHNTTTNVQHTTVINLNPIGKEDRSHITEKEWRHLVKLCADDNGPAAVARLVSLVNYNPQKPENMNTYFPPIGSTAPGVLCFYQQIGQPSKWRWVDRDLVIKWLADDRVGDLMEYVEDNEGELPKKQAKSVEDYHDQKSRSDDPLLRALIEGIAESGSRFVRDMNHEVSDELKRPVTSVHGRFTPSGGAPQS